jgi:O-antigen/teichoic acid export membrane protein
VAEGRPNDDLAKRLLSGTAINAAGAVIGKPLDLILLAIAVHRLGAAAFGVVVIAQGIGMWPTLAEKGVGQTMIRTVAGDLPDDEFRGAFAVGVLFYVLLGVATLVLGLGGVHALFNRVFAVPVRLRADAVAAAELLILAATIRNLTGFVPRILVGRTRFLALRATELTRGIGALALVVVLVPSAEHGMVAYGWAMVFSDLLAAALGLWLVQRELRAFTVRAATRIAISAHWVAARPVLAAGAIGLAWSRIDPVIIGIGLGPVAATTYGVAIRVYEMLQGLVDLLYLGLLPATASLLGAGDGRRVGRMLQRANTYATTLTWPGCVAVAMLAPEVVHVWIGRPLPAIWSTLIVTMALVAATTVPSSLMYVIIGADRVGSVLRVQLVAVVVNVAVSIGLLHLVGVGAVFLGTIAGTVLLALRSSQVVAEVTGGRLMDGWRGIARPLLLSMVLTAALAAARGAGIHGTALLVTGAFALAAYGAVALAWVLPREDLRHLRPVRA